MNLSLVITNYRNRIMPFRVAQCNNCGGYNAEDHAMNEMAYNFDPLFHRFRYSALQWEYCM